MVAGTSSTVAQSLRTVPPSPTPVAGRRGSKSPAFKIGLELERRILLEVTSNHLNNQRPSAPPSGPLAVPARGLYILYTSFKGPLLTSSSARLTSTTVVALPACKLAPFCSNCLRPRRWGIVQPLGRRLQRLRARASRSRSPGARRPGNPRGAAPGLGPRRFPVPAESGIGNREIPQKT
jgi:hypothetical protein